MAGHAANYAKQTVSLDTVRRVWAAISKEPRRSKLALMKELRIESASTFYSALYRLEQAGYIRHTPGMKDSWIVLVPFIITGRD